MRHLEPLRTASGQPALADRDTRLDGKGFRAAVASAAARLADSGVAPGDVVAAVLTNRVELVIAVYATWDLGAAFTPVNPALTPDEVRYQLADSGARVAVVEPTTVDKVHIDTIDATSLLGTGGAHDVHLRAQPDDLALVVYTSGTTGRPKGVMLTHRSVEAMTNMLLEANEFTAMDRSLLVLPLFHVNAIMLSVVTPLAVGASTYIAERFDAHGFWPDVERERPTFFSAVPAIYFFLTTLPEDIRPDVSSIRLAICGAAPMPPEAIVAFEARYGIPIIEGYGLSESTVALTANSLEHRRAGTVGRPLPGVEIRIADDDGQPAPDGVDGEVLARGPNIMQGYLDKPAETAAALSNGWLHTGDIGHLDSDGYLVLVDRKKDLIIRGGENIAPSEVEAVLQNHPGIAEAAVVGRPDPVMGEEPVAFVVPAPGHDIDVADVVAHCRRVLAPFKVPRAVHVVDSFPRNAVGKVTKHILRSQLAEGAEASPSATAT